MITIYGTDKCHQCGTLEMWTKKIKEIKPDAEINYNHITRNTQAEVDLMAKYEGMSYPVTIIDGVEIVFNDASKRMQNMLLDLRKNK